MYCSGCGLGLAPGQTFCPQCGRPVAMAAAPAIPGYELQLHNYSGQVRALSIVWFIYAGLTLLLGTAALAIFGGHLGTWLHGLGTTGNWPLGPWLGAGILRFAWVFLLARTALALAAGWGLQEHAPWGRVVAIIAAVLNVLHFFPFGAAIAVWTMVMLLGYRNCTLYERL